MFRRRLFGLLVILGGILLLAAAGSRSDSRRPLKGSELDRRVRAFLDSQRDKWRDMNVPEADGQKLYDLIIRHKYKRALDIGTSTGHSAIWMAWALSKTGGRLITIEIDEGRYREALANFKAAGLDHIIDARRADAHQLVKKLKGPFDIVFCDADKDWYINYFKDIFPKLEVGGCFAAHNVWGGNYGWRRRGGTGAFYDYVMSLSTMRTTVFRGGGGMSISFKTAKK